MQKDSEISNRGQLLTPTLELLGGIVPNGYRVTRCNTEHILCMLWNPLGLWEPTSTQVLRLASSECRLTIIGDNIKMRFAFGENDFRYSVDKWIVFVHKNEVEIVDAQSVMLDMLQRRNV